MLKRIILSLFLIFNITSINIAVTPSWAATFPTTPVLDSFNRSNGAPSGWTGTAFGDASGITISSNQATSGNASFGSSFYNVNTYSYGTNNVEVYTTIATLPASGKTVRLLICDDSSCAGANNAYYIIASPTSNWFLEKITAGVGAQLGATFTQAISAGDSVGLSVVGSTVTAWYKPVAGSWTTLTTRSDSSFIKKWFIGLELEDNTLRVDNFGGGIVGDNGKGFLTL